MLIPPAPTSEQIRLPVDCWDILRALGNRMGGAQYSAVVALSFRLLKTCKEQKQFELLSPPYTPKRETVPGWVPIEAETWRLVREFGRDWNSTAPATIANCLRIVDSFAAMPKTPKSLQSSFRILGIL